ncbi:MAG: hypothetical protein ABR599_08440 [Gemmatimonadota bacterium]
MNRTLRPLRIRSLCARVLPGHGLSCAGLVLAAALASLLPGGGASAQQPDSLRARLPADSARAGPGLETFVPVDTILVVEDREGLVWGDWYVNPEVGLHVQRAIERRGQLSGRTWLQSAAPIRDLVLARVAAREQVLSFVDKGVTLGFWKPGEVEYQFVFDGPCGVTARGVARPGDGGLTTRVPIALPLPGSAPLEDSRGRVARLDVTYRPSTRGAAIPRGSFTVYLYYVDAPLGYRIAGVGY